MPIPIGTIAQNLQEAVYPAEAVACGDIVTSRLFRTAYRVVASPEYLSNSPVIAKPEDLAEHACTLFTLPQFRTEWLFRSCAGSGPDRIVSVPISGGTAVSSALSLRSVALGGGGPALLADWLIGEDVSAGRLIDVLPDHEATATTFDTAAWIMYPSRAYLPKKVRVTIDFLKERLGRL